MAVGNRDNNDGKNKKEKDNDGKDDGISNNEYRQR